MSKSQFRQFIDTQGDLPDDCILGRIVMFTITDHPVAPDDYEKLFDDLNLNTAFLPPAIKPVDAFKKATMVVNDEEYELPNGTTATLLTRDVSSTPTAITRQLWREVRDSRNKRLRFDQVGEMVFYRPTITGGKTQNGTERLRLSKLAAPLDPAEMPQIDAAFQMMQDAYPRYRDFYDGMKIRDSVRRYLKYLNALEIKGGVYFVHATRDEELQRLATLVRSIGGGCAMYLVPLPDIQAQREMIVETFQREAEQSLNDLIKEIAHLRATRQRITPNAYAKLRDRFDTVMNQATEYTRTLSISQDRTGAAAELALDSLMELNMLMLNGTPA
jgi:hypothetical protein